MRPLHFYIFFLLTCGIFNPIFSQNKTPLNKKTFHCEVFSFEYPTQFKETTIQNAPHMVLKIESNDYIISASYWDYGLESTVNVWDDNTVQQYRQMDNENLVDISKGTIQTMDGVVKCLKLKFNIPINSEYDESLKTLSYLIINNGYLIEFSFFSLGKYTKNSPTDYSDEIMRGLLLNGNQKNSTDLYNIISKSVESLNAQLPIQIDECTTQNVAIFLNGLLMIKTTVPDYCEEFTDYEEFKNRMSKNFASALNKDFTRYLKQEKVLIRYMIYNEYDVLKKMIDITPNDILLFY